MRESPYFRALQTALHGAGVPYGYAVTVWSTGAALIGEHGPPSNSEILLLAAGATTGYGGLRLLTWETGGEAEKPLPKSPHKFRAGIVHVAAIGSAIGTAILLADIRGSAAFFVAMLMATVLYLGVMSVEVAAVEHGARPGSSDR